MRYDILEDNTLIVTPYKYKFLSYITDNKILKNIKFMNLDEFIKIVFFDYDEETIYYLMKNYNISYYSSLEYIKSLYFCNKKINNEKINFLLKIKQKLNDNNLLKYKKINYKNIIIYGYDYIDNYYKEEFKKYNVKYINYDYKINEIKKVYQLDNIYQEVLFVSEQIMELLNNGIDINKIKLLNLNNEYRKEIRKVFGLNSIPFEDIKIYLYELPIIKEYLKDMNINVFKTKDEIYEKLVNILNKYMWSSNLFDVKELIIEDLKKESINDSYINEIKEVNIDDINEDDYVFLLNYHSDSIPYLYTDIDYIDDKLKEKLGIDTSYIKNKYTKLELINKLKNISNLTISCNKQSYISNLLDDIEVVEYNNKYIYSLKSNNYNLGRMLDIYYKYGNIDSSLNKLYNDSYKNYKSYDNKYKKMNKDILKKYINNKLLLSYTKIESYFECNFKYYVNYILKIDKSEETFKIYLGKITHYILSKCFNNDFDFNKEFDKYLQDNKRDFNNKEKFFLHKLKQELIFIINVLKEQKKYTSLKDALYEQNVVIEKGNKVFEGVIDKLLYDDKDMSIIDYKTGSAQINMKNIKYGIGMQLPIYIYLSKYYFKDKNIAGFYLQQVLNNGSVNSTIQDKKNGLKLQGYSNSNIDILEKMDNSYENSELIKSLKVTNNGFSSYSKLISNQQIEELRNLSENKIEECFNSIFDCNFNINPKIIDNDNISCNHCKYKDLCFKTPKDEVYIESGDDK